uniref:Ankyrin and het domain protein n=1 Tax=Colletotrichum fructicola (strain Nara gc5) TaxID=1213859 RepID=L2FIY1_COLFN
MGQIYSKAQKVLLCIGPDHENNAQNASALGNDVSTMILETFETVGYSPGSFPYPEGDGMFGTDPRWRSFATMLETSWFRRGWVVQESGFAKQAIILWGNWQIPWDSFMRTWFLADRLNVFTFPSNPLLPTFDKIRKALNMIHRDVFLATHRQESVAWYPTSSLALTTNHLEIMRDSHDLLLADQRDRVYAFHALAQRTTPSTFQSYTPNYELSINDTYLDFARNYLLDKSDLTLLNYVHHDADSITDDLPSWCPRWDLNLFDNYISTPSSAIIRISKTTSVSVNILPADILQVRGVIIDSIAGTSALLSRETTIDDISLLWQSCRINRSSSIYPTDGNIVAFLNCLTIGNVRGGIDAWYGHYSHYLYQLFLRSKEPGIPKDLVSLVNETAGNPSKITDFIAESVHNRKFAVTERGYYGLVRELPRKVTGSLPFPARVHLSYCESRAQKTPARTLDGRLTESSAKLTSEADTESLAD